MGCSLSVSQQQDGDFEYQIRELANTLNGAKYLLAQNSDVSRIKTTLEETLFAHIDASYYDEKLTPIIEMINFDGNSTEELKEVLSQGIEEARKIAKENNIKLYI